MIDALNATATFVSVLFALGLMALGCAHMWVTGGNIDMGFIALGAGIALLRTCVSTP